MSNDRPFDAVLIVAFGGPNSMDDVWPFIENVLKGRRVPRERMEQVVKHYEHFNGISPINRLTQNQAVGLHERLCDRDLDLPVYVGMRNWNPFVTDTLRRMSDDGVRRAIGIIASAQHCYSSCGQYKESVREACQQLIEQNKPGVEITYVDSWYADMGFVATVAAHTQAALDRFDESLRDKARIVFTAHSIPLSMANQSNFVEQIQTSIRLVAERLGRSDWGLAYQSRSGRPTDPWLEPDVCDYLKAEQAKGLEAAVVVPIGFICDHIEVLWDLDVEVAKCCREIGLPMQRAETVNDDPLFVDTLADIVQAKYEQHATFPPLPIIAETKA